MKVASATKQAHHHRKVSTEMLPAEFTGEKKETDCNAIDDGDGTNAADPDCIEMKDATRMHRSPQQLRRDGT